MNLTKMASLASRLTSPRHVSTPSEEQKAGFLQCQRLAEEAAHEIASLMREGWTEKKASDLLGTYLRDRGVRSFFHHPYAWFGERARFDGIRKYKEYMSKEDRVLLPGEVFILDVAPIYHGYIADIGFTSSLGENAEWKKAKQFLQSLREEIPSLFLNHGGVEIWRVIDEKIQEAGYENIHKKYPFSVLGHRVHDRVTEKAPVSHLNFGWQSYWSIASRGVFGQLLGPFFEGDLRGLWAIEPHIGTKSFGAKFEEILVVEKDRAYWLEKERSWQ